MIFLEFVIEGAKENDKKKLKKLQLDRNYKLVVWIKMSKNIP